MGTTISIKRRGTYDKTKPPRGQRHMSCAVVREKNFEFASPKKRNPSSSFIQTFNSGAAKGSGKSYSTSSRGSCGSNSSCDVTEKDFVHKVQSYLHSIEQLGEMSDIKCSFGNLTLKTEDENFNVEVKEKGTEGESIVTLESEPNQSNTFMIYQYSTRCMSSLCTYFSLLYITDVERSDSKYYVLQANTSNPSGVPNFIPRRIKSSDNPKLVSPSSRFVGTFEKDGLTNGTNVLFYNRDQQPFYLTQSDLSLDFTTDKFRAGNFTNDLVCFEKII